PGHPGSRAARRGHLHRRQPDRGHPLRRVRPARALRGGTVMATETTTDATPVDAPALPRSVSPTADALRPLRRNPMAVLSGAVILAMIFLALFAPLLAPHPYDQQDRANTLVGKMPGHLLGTDNLGQDTLSRLIYGARVSLAVGLVVELIELLIGVSL